MAQSSDTVSTSEQAAGALTWVGLDLHTPSSPLAPHQVEQAGDNEREAEHSSADLAGKQDVLMAGVSPRDRLLDVLVPAVVHGQDRDLQGGGGCGTTGCAGDRYTQMA